MTSKWHGNPSWYELTTSKGKLKATEEFYSKVFGWTFTDSGMEGFDYQLAHSNGALIAGFAVVPDGAASAPPAWLIYFSVDNTDESVTKAKAAGSRIIQEPYDVPGTGRIAIIADPQGVSIGLLQPDMSGMTDSNDGASNQPLSTRGNWHELMTADPVAAFDFYSALLGWRKGEPMDMGEMGIYQLFNNGKDDVGGIMGLPPQSGPQWLTYFGVDGSVTDKLEAVKAAGGRVHNGPMEVPGGAFIGVAEDPQGAWFAVTSAKK